MIKSNNFGNNSFTLWIYRLLVRSYPISFRNRFESELIQTVKTYIRNSQNFNNKNALFDIWLVWIPDLCISVVSEKLKGKEIMMNKKTTVSQFFVITLMFLWIGFLGLTYARVFLDLTYKDPTEWLLGQNPSSLAYTALNGFLLLAPFVALILSVRPFLSINRASNSSEVAEIRVLKAKGLNLTLLVLCSTVSFLMVALFIAVRFFNL